MKKLTILPFLILSTSFTHAASVPDELEATEFSPSSVTPSPACLCAAPSGEVFVGVDMNGSLGKGVGKGKIVRLVDTDHDGQADSHTEFAKLDNPRGLISIGTKLYVLHTVIPERTGKLTGMHLSVLEDKNWDGVADGPPKRLVSDVSPPKHNQSRGADHTTNGIAMGIDGWIYIAVGDFGMVHATGTDGKSLTMLSGGVVRVRPDGTEIEVYTHGTRNTYDVAIDPFLNIFTRGNTNDGGGWNVRFLHHIQSGEYGYPVWYKHFTGELLPALEDLGGGSGTGALFFAEPGWPEKYTNVPMMCDWGRSQLVIHRLTPNGASFTQVPENFIKTSQIADVDVDGSGRMYLAAWAGAGYKGSAEKGYVERVVPKGWKYRPFPTLSKGSEADLLGLMRRPSAVARLHAQQTLIARKASPNGALALAADSSASLKTRVAAIFTARQLGAEPKAFYRLAADPALREFVLRALADRKSQHAGVPTKLFEQALGDENPRVQVAAAVGLGRLGEAASADALLAVSNPPAGTYAPQPDGGVGTKVAYKSKKQKPKKTAKINVNVSKWKELHLVVTDGSDGNGNDHVGWFDPVIEMADGSKVPLTDIKWKTAKGGWGKTLANKDCTGAELERADGKTFSQGIGTHAPSHIVFALPEGAKRFTANAGATKGALAGNAYVEFVVHSTKPVFSKNTEGPHATPNAAIVLPHVAVQSLKHLQAVDASLKALDGSNRAGALWAMKYMHTPQAVDGLIARASAEKDEAKRAELIALLARLYHREKAYDGSWWWGTRPDTRGPYYQLETWEKSDAIADVIKREYERGDDKICKELAFWNARLRLGFDYIKTPEPEEAEDDEPTVDLAKITSGAAGEVGKAAIEDVMVALDNLKGDLARGKELFTLQGCVACHTIADGQPLKGPHMGQVGAILSREQIAESIIKPNASISQGFATVLVETKDGKVFTGFVTLETADEMELRDIVGMVHKVKKSNIKKHEELEISMMPPGLANSLSMQDFVSLVDFLASKKN